MLALIQSVNLDSTTTYVSVGVLIVVLGAAVRITQLLTRISEQLAQALAKLAVLEPIPSQLALLDQRVLRVEGDVDELWGLVREGPDGSGGRRRGVA